MRITKVVHLAALLAAALAASQFVSAPAFADQQDDVKSCFAGDGGDTGRHIAVCTRIIDSGKLNQRDLAGAYNWRGEAYRISKQYDLALADYARSIEINPNSVFPFANRAEVYRMQGKFDLVIADATAAIRIDPMLNASYAIRGMAYEKTNDLDRARADFNKALELPIKGNDGQWAQDIARNHLQSMGGGENRGSTNNGRTNNAPSNNSSGTNVLMNNGDGGGNNANQVPGGGTSGGNILMNR